MSISHMAIFVYIATQQSERYIFVKEVFTRRYSLRQSVFRIYMYYVFVQLIMVMVLGWLYNIDS